MTMVAEAELTVAEIKEIIRKNNGGNIIKDAGGVEGLCIYGPYTYDEYKLWEVWVKQSDIFHVRFIICGNAEPFYCNDVPQLCNKLQRHLTSLKEANNKVQPEAKFKLMIAAFVFVFLVCILGYKVITDKNESYNIWWLFSGLMISGGAFFFGRWMNPSRSQFKPS